jgi:GNAT superfamily N-acetyltransferase
MRYRLPEGYAQPMTDVIGELVGLDPPTVRSADGEVVSVTADRVVALKALGPRPIRTSDIRALEAAAANGWPGVDYQPLDGWLLRASGGYTHRGNSAVPLDPSANTGASTLTQIAYWYRQRGLAATLVLPDRVLPVPPGWPTFNETLMMAVDLNTVVLPEGPSIVTIDPAPGPGWLGLFAHHDPRAAAAPIAINVVTAVREGTLGFAALGDPTGHLSGPAPDGSASSGTASGGSRSRGAGLPLAIARGAVTDAPNGRRWIGLSGVHVTAAHRGHGLGTLICAEVLRWGRARGATHAYLQVSVDNSAAIAMYRALGFVTHHRYRHVRIPGAT